MLGIRPHLLLTTLAATSSAGAQDTLVVDASGAPDADHSTFAGAIDAAQDGDRILVRRGSYGPIVIAGKGLRIEVDEDRLVFVDSIEIRSLAPGQTVTMRGLTLAPGVAEAEHGVVIEDCAASVWLEEIDTTFDYRSSLEPVRVVDSTDVVVTRSNFAFQRPSPPTAVFALENSSTYVLDTVVDNCGTTGFDVRGGFLGLSALAFNPCFAHGGGAGVPVLIDGGAQVEQQGSFGPVLFPLPVIVSGTYVPIASTARTHQASSPAYGGDSVTVEITGEPGDLVWVLFSAVGEAQSFAKIDVPLFLAMPVMSIALGTISASRTIEFGAPIGPLGTSSSVVVNSQAFFWNKSAQAMVLSEPTAVTLLNQGLRRADYLYPAAPTWTGNLTGTTSFGASLGSAGDVNGDGFEDVIIADPAFGLETTTVSTFFMRGAACVYHGSVSGIANEPAWCQVGSKRLRSAGATMFGTVVGSAGDVNGDGFGDVLVTSSTGSQLFVFYGSAVGVRSDGFSLIEEFQPWKFQGQAVGAGDVNGDGFDDVLMMAECWSPTCEVGGKNRFGRLYHGSANGLITEAPAWEFIAPGTYIANVGSAGDVNGDGFGDIMVGSVSLGGPSDISLFLGDPVMPTLAWTYQARGLVFDDYLCAGDIDGDGLDDLVFGDGYARLLVFRGASPQPASSPDQVLITPFYHGLGEIRALGDVDGDGFADVAVDGNFLGDAPWFLFRGSAQGLRRSPSWSYETTPDLLSSLAGVGDLNGDGKSEVFVGEYDWRLGRGAGTAFGFFSLP